MTDLLTIVPQQQSHAQGLFEALRDPRLYAHLDGGPPADVETIAQRIARQAHGPKDGAAIWLNWSVFVGEDIVGMTQATIFPPGQADLAYVLSPRVWGKGIAELAVRRMIDVLIRHHNVTRLLADTDQNNTHSQALLKRLGFREFKRDGRDIFFAKPADNSSAF